jgi:hypothetical protein
MRGVVHEARWLCAEPRREVGTSLADRLLRSAFGDCRISEIEPLAGGLRNANFKVKVDTRAAWFVLRIYEHDT